MNLIPRNLAQALWTHQPLPASAATVGIRPEQLQLASEHQPGLIARVELIEYLGHETLLHLRAQAEKKPIVMRMSQDTAPHPDTLVTLQSITNSPILFDADGTRLTGAAA